MFVKAKKFFSISNQRGDTIVEVLIAAAIISLVLVAAYGLTSRNTRAIMDNQEQSFGMKLAEEQLEFLGMATAAPTGQCYVSPATEGSGAVCDITNGGATYRRTITTSGGVHRVTVSWDSVMGYNKSIDMYYKRAT